MRRRLQQLRRDERGISFVYVGVSFLAFFAASTLAIDVGLLMTARSQAQNSADAGALAGAVALFFNDFDDRTSSGPAVQSALSAARANAVIGEDIDVQPADVTFPVGPTGVSNRVKVTVYRSSERNNALGTMIGAMLGVTSADIVATATAEASPADAIDCALPFTVPDKWREMNEPGGWTPDSEFTMLDKKGNTIANPDVYVPGPDGTGYNAQRDKGTQLVLKTDNNSKVAPSIYNPWTIGGQTGASVYRNNIANCSSGVVQLGQILVPEPGMMQGPTVQGVKDLIDKDPNAEWDEDCNCVKGSAFPLSPRIAKIPLYDPVYYEEGKATGRNASLRVANFLGIFLVGMNGNEVIGRITPITGVSPGEGGGNAGSFPMVIRLVE
jgi:Flp pilus assembly protein TadG